MDKDRKIMIEHLAPMITEELFPGHVLPYLTEFTREQMSRIRKTEKSKGNAEASEELISILLSPEYQCANPGWFKQFTDALKEAEFEPLCQLLEGREDVKDTECLYKLIRLFNKALMKINPEDLLPGLYQRGAISHRDKEEIGKSQETSSSTAMMQLIDTITRRHPDWFAIFMCELKEQGYEKLVNQIIPEFEDHGNLESLIDIVNKHSRANAGERFETIGGNEFASDPKKLAELGSLPNQASMGNKRGSTSEVKVSGQEPKKAKEDKGGEKSDDHSTSLRLNSNSDIEVDGSESSFHVSYSSSGGSNGQPLNAANSMRSQPDGREEPMTDLSLDLETMNIEDESAENPDLSSSSSTQVNGETHDESRENPFSSLDREATKAKLMNFEPEPSNNQNSQALGQILAEGQPQINNNLNSGFEKTSPLREKIIHDDEQSEIDNAAIGGSSVGLPCKSSDLLLEDDEAHHIEPEVLELRSYQLELAESAMDGKNTIVVAPTGSGKTHVALKISQHHMQQAEEQGDHKIVFMVPTVDLVTQQHEMYQKYLHPHRSIGIHGGDMTTEKVPLMDLITSNDILVMTPQILVDCMKNGDLTTLSNFTLMIFDECHHTTKGHPYNVIMGYYLDEKIKEEGLLPQIVGLTASVGVGKARNQEGAIKHILKLCANLDAPYISTVKRKKADLMGHQNQAEQEMKEVSGRKDDPFDRVISDIMKLIERRMKDSTVYETVKEISNFDKALDPPTEKGSQRYINWLSTLRKQTARIRNSDTRRFYVACIIYLDLYNNALLINEDCRTKDALAYLMREFEECKPPYADETDKWLEETFKNKQSFLEDVSVDERYMNPKLLSLQKIITEYYERNPDSRTILFCKTRQMTVALKNWMKDTPGLRELNPNTLVGSNAPNDKAGMTHTQQVDTLKYFKDGKHKIVIATSVAEEGIDIQKCNLVIRYEHVTNEIAMVQARGRGRAAGAQYLVVAQPGKGTVQREEMNQAREKMMNKALEKIDTMNISEIYQRINEFQKEAKSERDMQKAGKDAKMAAKEARRRDSDLQLRCGKCDELACFSSDIRKIEDSHHAVIAENFADVCRVEKHNKPSVYGEFSKTGKVYCAKCKHDWGIIAIYKFVPFHVLKAVSFVYVDIRDKRAIYKKWKDVPCYIEKLSVDDLQRKSQDEAQNLVLNS